MEDKIIEVNEDYVIVQRAGLFIKKRVLTEHEYNAMREREDKERQAMQKRGLDLLGEDE